MQNLRKDYLYGIRMGYREILTEEKIKMLPVEEFQYPVHLENRIQTALCSESPENLKKECENFLKYTREMKCSPRYIRKTYKKMLAFLENVCHEVNQQAYKLLQNQDLEHLASEKITAGELESCFRKAVEIILESRDKKEDIRNYAIRRAINFIREHYSENISLDMLAERLEITPEYLSTLFNKEVGINFSTFLKCFRISQAKRLLKGMIRFIPLHYRLAIMIRNILTECLKKKWEFPRETTDRITERHKKYVEETGNDCFFICDDRNLRMSENRL